MLLLYKIATELRTPTKLLQNERTVSYTVNACVKTHKSVQYMERVIPSLRQPARGV